MKNSNNQVSSLAHSAEPRLAKLTQCSNVGARLVGERPGGCLDCSNHNSKGRAPRLPFSARPAEGRLANPVSAGSSRDAERQRSPELLPRGRHKKRPRVWLEPGSASGARYQSKSSPWRVFSGPDESQAVVAPHGDPEGHSPRTSFAASREPERTDSSRHAGAPAAVEKPHLPAGPWPRGHLPDFRGSSPLSTPCLKAVGSGSRAFVLNPPTSLRRGSPGFQSPTPLGSTAASPLPQERHGN